MWEAKLNSSKAIQTNEDLNENTLTAPSPANASHKLPTQPPTPRSNQASSAGSSNNNNIQSSSKNQQNPPSTIDLTSNQDIKPNIQYMDQHTRTAIQAAYFNNNSNNSGNSLPLANAQDQAARIKKQLAGQLDGHGLDGGGSSSEDDEDDDEISVPHDDDDDADDKTNNDDANDYEGKEDPDPLNSNDDLTEPGSPDSQSDLFDTEHVIVCQYDKVNFLNANEFKALRYRALSVFERFIVTIALPHYGSFKTSSNALSHSP